MSMPPDTEPTSKDPTEPASANPAGGTGGTAVAPPEATGPRSWRPLVLVIAAVIVILLILLVLAF